MDVPIYIPVASNEVRLNGLYSVQMTIITGVTNGAKPYGNSDIILPPGPDLWQWSFVDRIAGIGRLNIYKTSSNSVLDHFLYGSCGFRALKRTDW